MRNLSPGGISSEIIAYINSRIKDLKGGPTINNITNITQEVVIPTVKDIDVITVDGVNTIQFRDILITQYETLILDCADDGKKYRIIKETVDGETTFRVIPADYVEAADGNTYQLKVRLIDGIPTLEEPTLVT